MFSLTPEEALFILRSSFASDSNGPWIQTLTGGKFFYLYPERGQLELEDILGALSYEARFGGHTKRHYTVGQHSILGAKCLYDLVRNEWLEELFGPPGLTEEAFGLEEQRLRLLPLEFLLHDAAEAFCKDIPTPLKTMLPFYKAIEHSVDQCIRAKFGLSLVMSKEVKDMDMRMLALEHSILCAQTGPGLWNANAVPADTHISRWSTEKVADKFLETFYRLKAFATDGYTD